jgi:hypothetical protein
VPLEVGSGRLMLRLWNRCIFSAPPDRAPIAVATDVVAAACESVHDLSPAGGDHDSVLVGGGGHKGLVFGSGGGGVVKVIVGAVGAAAAGTATWRRSSAVTAAAALLHRDTGGVTSVSPPAPAPAISPTSSVPDSGPCIASELRARYSPPVVLIGEGHT